MKRFTFISGTVFLVVLLALPAFANNHDWDRDRPMKGYRQEGSESDQRHFGRFNNLSEEQRNQIKKLRQDLFDRTADLRTQVIAKSAELNIFLNTTNPDIDKAKALQKELSNLQAKMDQERIIFLLEIRKIDPDFRMSMRSGAGRYHHWGGRPDNRDPHPYMRQSGPGMY